MKKDGKENTIMFWNAQNWCCMAERKETSTALENRDVACATATDKIRGQKGNKLNPKNACIFCSRTGHVSVRRERAFRNICRPYHTIPYHTIPYHTIPNSTMWKEYKDFKHKH